MSGTSATVSLFVTSLLLGTTNGLFVDGCALFGCRPSGSFSFYLNVPRNNATINWISGVVRDSIPNALGCVADSISIICPSNGIFSDERGYVSINGENGTLQWRDKYLTFPTLPILDNNGDVTGSDGVSLVHYDMDGKKYPVITCQGMEPIFSMQLVGTMFLLMVSEHGCLSVRDTNAIPIASIFLDATIKNTNGTFLPVSQPVVNGQRFYLLTEFVPLSVSNRQRGNVQSNPLGQQRLYAIDVHKRMANVMTVAWFHDFEQEKDELYIESNETELKKINFMKYVKRDMAKRQVSLWDYSTETLYVSLPPPYNINITNDTRSSFFSFSDTGNASDLNWHNKLKPINMAIFEKDTTDMFTSVNSGRNQIEELNPSSNNLWIMTNDSVLIEVLEDGNLVRTIYISAFLGTDVRVTSRLSVIRQNDTSADILVFAVITSNATSVLKSMLEQFAIDDDGNTSFVIAMDTTRYHISVLWMVPVPGNLEVKGQISGSNGADFRRKDQLVVYADDGKNAKIFSIH